MPNVKIDLYLERPETEVQNVEELKGRVLLRAQPTLYPELFDALQPTLEMLKASKRGNC